MANYFVFDVMDKQCANNAKIMTTNTDHPSIRQLKELYHNQVTMLEMTDHCIWDENKLKKYYRQ
jgi:cysteine sulfinate desulfinase/cysteine desulfurase-like protein